VKLLETIVLRAEERGLEALLAGGHAVMVHGYERTTFDADLLIRRTDREKWLALMRDLGFALFHEGPAFLQFNPPPNERLPVDLMFANQQTFDLLRDAALPNPLGGTWPRVVSLRHLLAMKCHAIKHGHAGRLVKDVDDVIHLFQINRLNPDAPEWRELVLKYGTEELHQKLRRIRAGNPD
jgi:hypothetical protein